MTTIVFLLIGLAVSIPQLADAFVPSLWALVGLLVARAAVVYGLLGAGSRALARLGWGRAVPSRWLHLIAWAGLRGAIAVALALSLPAGIPQRDLLQGIVFGCVLLTLLLQGTTAEPLVRRLGIEVVDEAPRDKDVRQTPLPDGSGRGVDLREGRIGLFAAGRDLDLGLLEAVSGRVLVDPVQRRLGEVGPIGVIRGRLGDDVGRDGRVDRL